jgi:hypothetical protein
MLCIIISFIFTIYKEIQSLKLMFILQQQKNVDHLRT